MALSDATTEAALRGFGAAAGPVLDQLAGFGERLSADECARTGASGLVRRRLAAKPFPGSPVWPAMTAGDRAGWWVSRIWVVLSSPAAAPQLLGSASDRFPVGAAIEAAARGLVVCATAREYGVPNATEQITVLARVLLQRDLVEPPDGCGGGWLLPARSSGAADVVTESVRMGRDLLTLVGDVAAQLDDLSTSTRKRGWGRIPGVMFVRTAKELRATLDTDSQKTAELLADIAASRHRSK